MIRTFQKTFFPYIFVNVLLLISCLASNGVSGEILFAKAPVALSAALPADGMSKGADAESIIVTANADLLKNSPPGQQLIIQLDDQTYIGIQMKNMRQAKNGFVWTGSVSPEYGSGNVFFFVRNSAISGRIIYNGKAYQVTSIGTNALHRLTNLDELTPVKNSGDALPAPVENEGQDTIPLSYSVPDGSTKTTIDLLLLYTPGMAAKYPGEALDTYLSSLVELANQAYINSNINLQLNIVGEIQVDYPDNTDSYTALNRLTNGSDAFANVPSLRDQYGADLVCLVRVFTSSNAYCGLAWLLKSLNPNASQKYGFSVIQTGTAGSSYCQNLTLAHEIGHNLGCAHDKDHAEGPGIFSYSYGYDIPGIFATIMSYDSPRIDYFSNPDISYKGHSIGIQGQADNAATINQTKTVVASFRQSSSGGNDGDGGGGGDDGGGSVDYCSSKGDSQKYEWIRQVHIASFSNSSGAAPYSDFTDKTIALAPGQNAAVALTPGFSGKAYTEYWRIWIDYNKDGDFSDPGELVFTGNSSGVTTGSIPIPASATGSTRMRISMQYKTNPPACGSFGFGEVEDYTVEFTQGGGGSGGGDDGGGSVDYCSSKGDSQKYEWIRQVHIASFSNSSGAAPYSDFTDKTIALAPGQNAAVALTPGFSGKAYTEYWRIWIDYNKDGDFSDPGELVFTGNSSGVTTGSIPIPASATGSTRMRISMQYKTNPPACGSFGFGEVEDYTVSFETTN